MDKQQSEMDKQQSINKYNELIDISFRLLEIYNYIDDEDCKLHSDDFMHVITAEIEKIMETLKDRYYNLYTYRSHQRC